MGVVCKCLGVVLTCAYGRDLMATPVKPWERASSTYRPPAQPGTTGTTVANEDTRKGDGSYSPQRPAVPPRPATTGRR